MSAILEAILCFLKDMLYLALDIVLRQWDGILSAVDSVASSVGVVPWTFTAIPSQYAWLLGLTGVSEALTIIAGALAIRFLMQSIPFVRWGS